MSRPESVSSRIASFGIEHGHLEDLVALLFAAGKAFVDGPVEQALVDVQDVHLLADQLQELRRRPAPPRPRYLRMAFSAAFRK